MKPYFDASVLTALALAESSASAIIRWTAAQAGGFVPAFSDFGRGEVASALGRRVRASEFDALAAMDALTALDAAIVAYEAGFVLSEDVELARSYVLRFDLGLRLPDAIHIAIARRLGATLVSLDKRQLGGARSLGIDVADPLA